MIRQIKDVAGFALDLLYPELCMFCDAVLGSEENEKKYLTCGKCLGEINVVHRTDSVFCLLKYVDAAEKVVRAFKYHKQKRYAYCAGLLVASYVKKDANALQGDVIMPIPLFAARQKQRGYNQAEVMCGAIAAETGLPVLSGLRRIKNTPALYGLSREEREQAIAGAFDYIPEKDGLIRDKTVILVDDILTSGATFNECAKVLKENGAAEVKLVTFAYS